MGNEKLKIEEGHGGEPDIVRRTFDFAVRVVKLCDALAKRRSCHVKLRNQLFAAGTSIGANVEEAQAGQSRADFLAKMTIALKEAREVCYWLRLLIASQPLGAEKLQPLADEADAIKRILAQIVVNTKRNSKAP